jgi:hypothetical protein
VPEEIFAPTEKLVPCATLSSAQARVGAYASFKKLASGRPDEFVKNIDQT